MPLTKEQLLIPRVMCIGKRNTARNPFGIFYTENDILTQGRDIMMWDSEDRGEVYFDPDWVEMMPHLFKRLKWHEKRDVKEMPEYIKQLDIVHPAKNWNLLEDCRWVFEFGHFGKQTIDDKMLPATQEQYNNYIDNIRGKLNTYKNSNL